MEGSMKQAGPGRGWGRVRARIRGGLSSRTGRTVGATSILTPLVGYIIHDLQKPDSVIRQLSKAAVNKLVSMTRRPRQLVDISDKAEVEQVQPERKVQPE